MQFDLQKELRDRLRPEDIWPFLRKGWWLILGMTLLATLVAGTVAAVSPREYRATAVIRIVPVQGQEVKSRDVLDLDVRGFQEVERFYRTQMQLFKSRSFAEEVASRYQKKSGQEISVRRVLGSLEVAPIERSQLVQVSAVDGDPERAAELANLAASTFVDMNIQWRQDLAKNANDWVRQRIEEVGKRRDDKVRELLEFKRQNNIVDRGSDNDGALSSRMSALERSYGQISTDRVLLESRLAGHEALFQRGNFRALGAQDDFPLPPGLRELHATTLAEHTAISARYGEQHPEFIRSKAALERVENQFRAEVRRSIQAERAELELLRSQEDSLADERLQTKDEVLAQQKIDAEYRKRQQELTQIEATLQSLLARADELEMSSHTESNNAQRVDDAIAPDSFIRPRITLTVGAGFVVGLLLGMIAALLRGLLDDTILSPADIETYTQQPVMGVVPRIALEGDGKAELLAHNQPRSTVAEAIRGVVAMAENRPDGRSPRRLLVTSSVVSEGKTTIAAGVATVLAQRGRRVVLVEGDHRRPRLHKVFGIPNERGVVEVLLGQITLDQALVRTEIPNLVVLPRGASVPGGTELIGSTEMGELLDTLSERFDRIVLDTPPSAALSDSITLSRWVDGLIVVARAGAVSRSLVRHTLRRLEQVAAPVLGVVLNDFRNDKTGRYSAYYSEYYYYYSSSEGEDEDEGEAAK